MCKIGNIFFGIFWRKEINQALSSMKTTLRWTTALTVAPFASVKWLTGADEGKELMEEFALQKKVWGCKSLTPLGKQKHINRSLESLR